MPALLVETRRPTAADVSELVANLRDQDVDELRAAGYEDFGAIITESLARSDWSVTATVDGRLACIFGVSAAGTLLSAYGVPWMLGTSLVATNRRALARLAPRYIHEMLQAYPTLRNLVHADNTVALGWLRHVGFTIGPVVPHPNTGAPFHVFELNRKGGTAHL